MAATNTPNFWDRMARKYAGNPIADTPGYERSLDHTRRYLKGSDVVLEFGCGTGTTALKLAPSVARIVATDFSAEMIAIAREKGIAEGCNNVTFDVAAPNTGAWPDEAFDAALAFNVLHLVQSRQAALANVRRVLKPGGFFISKTPCLKEANPIYGIAIPLMQAFGRAPYVASFATGELEQEIVAAGFKIVDRARHGSRKKDARPFLVAQKI